MKTWVSKLKKYTQADFDALERDEDGYINVPTGDWSAVEFDYTENLKIAKGCYLGDACCIGDDSVIGSGCVFGDHCVLEFRCTIGACCTFGDNCTFGDWCTFGNWCTLGCNCRVGWRCKIWGVENFDYIKAGPIGTKHKAAYAFCNTETGKIICLDCNGYPTDIDTFEKKLINGDYDDDFNRHPIDDDYIEYKAFIAFARAMFAKYNRD